jgi:hypothetical protein
MIISVSRRCDIPRFRFDWFMECLNRGYEDVKNPFNPRQVRRVSIAPGDTFAFWTRDPRFILAHAEELGERGFSFFAMVTLTGYPAALEPNMPPMEAVIRDMGLLAQKIGLHRVIWRYDPVFLSEETGFEFHRRNFALLSGRLKGAVSKVIVSVYDEYAGAKRRLRTLEEQGLCRPLPHYDGGGRLLPALRSLLDYMAGIAKEAGMEIQSCAEAEDLSSLGIKAGACVTGPEGQKDRNQRPCCLCASSADIGSYGPCPAGCIYCYARR